MHTTRNRCGNRHVTGVHEKTRSGEPGGLTSQNCCFDYRPLGAAPLPVAPLPLLSEPAGAPAVEVSRFGVLCAAAIPALLATSARARRAD